ncbi:MAG: sugar transferase [Candidatus Omnitrophica bacterium]|nr:sugar transferase [Candidatus Omnitrophota bacterium]
MSRKIFSLLDAVVIFSAFLLAYWLRFNLPIFPEKVTPPLEPYLQIAVFAAFTWVFILSILGIYQSRLFLNFCSHLEHLLQGSFWGMVFIMAGTALYRGFSYSRLALSFGGLLGFCWLVILHFLVHLTLRKREKRKVIFIGEETNLTRILKRFRRQHPFLSVQVLSEFDLSALKKRISAGPPDFVITNIAESEMSRALQEICEEFSIPLYVLPDFSHFLFAGKIENIDGLPLLISTQLPLEGWPARFLKRTTDLLLGNIFALLFCLTLPFLAMAIKMNSPGPIFFTQTRVGQNRRLFRIFKFRTMKYPYVTSPPYTETNDPRVTTFGRFLRRYNLDELPQIFNVLSGEMSLVGPRPISSEDIFFLRLPDFPRRLRIKPGITGWAQVHGLRGSHTEPEERIFYDLYYIQNWSWWLDIAIIICSFFSFKNAY